MLLSGYIALSLCRGYALVAAIIWAIFGLFEFVQVADAVDGARFTVVNALAITALAMPARLVDFLPFIALLGTIYGLTAFVRTHELVVMLIGGLTPSRLIVTSLLMTTGLILSAAALELIARPMAQEAEYMFMSRTSTDGSLFTKSGIWVQIAPLSYLHIESLAQGGTPTGIRIIDWKADHRLERFVTAEHAEIGNEGAWHLTGISEREFSDQDGPQGVTVNQNERSWEPPGVRSVASFQLPVASLSVAELGAQMAHLKQFDQQSGVYGVEFWHRLFLPLTALFYATFAIPLILAIPPRAGGGVWFLVGIVGACSIYLVQQLASLGMYLASGSGLGAALFPLAISGLAIWALAQRQFGRRRPRRRNFAGIDPLQQPT